MLKSNGLTLVELLIALLISSILFTGLIAIFVANVKHHNDVTNVNRLNQQLEGAMDLMSSEIRRASYWANSANDIGLDQNTNPFMTSSTDITVNGSNNCILFTYDHDKNGSLPQLGSTSDDERYGFRLNGQAIQTRPGGASYSCTSNDWENITDSNFIHITALNFVLTNTSVTVGPGTKGIMIRSVDITLTGSLANDSSVSKTLTQHIRVRNDKIIP